MCKDKNNYLFRTQFIAVFAKYLLRTNLNMRWKIRTFAGQQQYIAQWKFIKSERKTAQTPPALFSWAPPISLSKACAPW